MFAELAVAFLTLSGAAFAAPTRVLEARNLGRGETTMLTTEKGMLS